MQESEQVTSCEAQPSEPHQKRRCEHINEEGRRCARWASRGEELCHPHLRYAEACARRRVDVPLLDDEVSILYVLSQTAQSLATGGMPPANGHAVISACKLATRVLELRLKQAQWQAKQSASASAREAACPIAPAPTPAENAASATACPESSVLEDDQPLMAVTDEDYDEPFVPEGQRPGDRVRNRVEAAAAEKDTEQGPTVQLPRFHRENLQEQWENGREGPWLRNQANLMYSKTESRAILDWKAKHPDIVRAREQHMLDVYYGRVKSESKPIL